MVWSSWQYFRRYFLQFIFSSFAKGLGLRFVIVSILFWLWELSLPVRGAWERGCSWGSSYTERERRHPKNNPPKNKVCRFLALYRAPFLFARRTPRRPRLRRLGQRGRAAPGSPGSLAGAAAPSGPLRALRAGSAAGGSAGSVPAPRCLPGRICKHLAGDGWPAGGRRQPPCLLPCDSLGFSRRRFHIEFVGKKSCILIFRDRQAFNF